MSCPTYGCSKHNYLQYRAGYHFFVVGPTATNFRWEKITICCNRDQKPRCDTAGLFQALFSVSVMIYNERMHMTQSASTLETLPEDLEAKLKHLFIEIATGSAAGNSHREEFSSPPDALYLLIATIIVNI